MRKLLLVSVILTVLFILCGCTTFEVFDPISGQPCVKSTGAPFLSRKDGFQVRREWLDEKNVLNVFSVQRNTDENADAQVRALELIKEAYSSRIPPIVN